MKKTTLLKKKLLDRRGLVVPGCYDALSAKLIERCGFEALQASGFALSASMLGLPDVGLISFYEVLMQTRNIVNAVEIPVMADADTGYGNALNVIRTVREFERIGCAGVNIEDQVFPKKCGHMEGKRLISEEEMVLKIMAARDAVEDPDFVINARTDAISVYGIEEAIKRGNSYAKAGADIIFVEAPESVEDIRRIVKEINAPVSINLFDAVTGGKTPLLSIDELRQMGVARISIPVGLIFAATRGMINYLSELKKYGILPARSDLVVSFDEFKSITGYREIKLMEERYLPHGE
ncbi:MAG: isocitrate lyase/PEP mutase family protein [Candidatus Aenigmatarchaeota archaeon]